MSSTFGASSLAQVYQTSGAESRSSVAVWQLSDKPEMQHPSTDRRFSLHRATKIVLRNNPVLHRPDHERHVRGQVREVVFAPVAFLKLSPRTENRTFLNTGRIFGSGLVSSPQAAVAGG